MVLALIFAAGARAQQVTKVSSGDTIFVSGVGKIRLLGIRSLDEPALRVGPGTTPPPQPRTDPSTPPPAAISGAIRFDRARPSRDFLRQLLLGKAVRIQYDPLVHDASEMRAYVFLPDGTLVNAEMLRQGKARADVSLAFAHQEEFKRLEEQARADNVGAWATLTPR